MADAAGGALPSWGLGCKVVLQTTMGKEVSGEVFAYDASTETVVLVSQGAHPGQTNIMLLLCEHVKEVISCTPPTEPIDQDLPMIDKKRTHDRMTRAVEAATEMAQKMGVGVTRQAQIIFDALAKTMPCTWRGKTIVVLDEVLVAAPYTLAETSAKDPRSPALQRVRKVLERERSKLGLPN